MSKSYTKVSAFAVWCEDFFRRYNGAFKVRIDAYDNPGWGISIDAPADVSRIGPVDIHCDRSDGDWIYAGIRSTEFYVAGGLYNLGEVITVFLECAEHAGRRCVPSRPNACSTDGNAITLLQSWFGSHCDGDWEHSAGFTITMTDRPGWAIRQSFSALETRIDAPAVREWRTEDDWIEIDVVDDALVVSCSLLNLGEGIERCVTLVKAAELAAGLHDGVRWLPGSGREEGV